MTALLLFGLFSSSVVIALVFAFAILDGLLWLLSPAKIRATSEPAPSGQPARLRSRDVTLVGQSRLPVAT
jgi:hypothetical protein